MTWTNPLMKKSFETRGWITLASGFFLHITLGTFYLWGSIVTYTTSYLQQHGSDVNNDDANLVFPFTYLSINAGIVFGVILAKKIGFQKFLFCGSFLCGLAVFISSFLIAEFMLFVVFYAILFGFVCGLLYMVPFNTCYMYFPHRKGLVAGVITAGFGFGSVIFIWVIYFIVNSQGLTANQLINGHKYYSTEVTDKYPGALKVLSLIIFVVGSGSSFFHLRPTDEEAKEFEIKIGLHKPERVQELPMATHTESQGMHLAASVSEPHKNEDSHLHHDDALSDHKSQEHVIINPPSDQESDGLTHYEFDSVKEALSTRFIYCTTVMAFAYTAFGTMIVSQYKNYGQTLGYSDSFLSTVGTAGSIVNGLTRIVWGSLLEKYSFQRLLWVNLCMQMAISFTLRWVASNSGLFFIYVLFGYFLYGAWQSLMPAMVSKVYGKKIGNTIYCVTYFGYACAAFTEYFMVRFVKDTLGWGETFWIFTAIVLFGFIFQFFVKFRAVPQSKQHTGFEAIVHENHPLNHATS